MKDPLYSSEYKQLNINSAGWPLIIDKTIVLNIWGGKVRLDIKGVSHFAFLTSSKAYNTVIQFWNMQGNEHCLLKPDEGQPIRRRALLGIGSLKNQRQGRGWPRSLMHMMTEGRAIRVAMLTTSTAESTNNGCVSIRTGPMDEGVLVWWITFSFTLRRVRDLVCVHRLPGGHLAPRYTMGSSGMGVV